MPRGFETFNQARVMLMIKPHGSQQNVKRAQELNGQSIGIRESRRCDERLVA